MATLSYSDDERTRYVVRAYRYDPDRNERRHLVVAVFDNEAQFLACIDQGNADLRNRRARGDLVDPQEHLTGIVLLPGQGALGKDAH